MRPREHEGGWAGIAVGLGCSVGLAVGCMAVSVLPYLALSHAEGQVWEVG